MSTMFVTVAIARPGKKPTDDQLCLVESFPLTEAGIESLAAHLRARLDMPSVEPLPPCGRMAL